MELPLQEELQNIDKDDDLRAERVESLLPGILDTMLQSAQWKSLLNATKTEVFAIYYL
jgi:hypothetical protein